MTDRCHGVEGLERTWRNGGPVSLMPMTSEIFRSTYAAIDAAEALNRDAVAVLSHELRTPLSTIMVCTDMILSGVAGATADAALTRYLTMIHRSGQQMMSLMDGLLEMASLDVGPSHMGTEIVSIESLLEEAQELAMAAAAESGVHLFQDTDFGGVVSGLSLRVDRVRMVQALGRLLSIAVNNTAKGGTVRFRLRAINSIEGIVLDVVADQLAIEDANVPLVLAPFGRAAAVAGALGRQGAGLGVALAKKVIEGHGGQLDVDHDPDHGLTVSVTLPPNCLVEGHGAWAPDSPTTSHVPNRSIMD